MRRRVQLKRKIHLFGYMKKRNLFLIVFLLVILGIICVLNYANKRFSPIVLDYAETEVRKISNIFINMAVSSKMTDRMDLDSLFVVDKDQDGTIRMIDFNPVIVNQMLTEVVVVVNKNLKALATGNLDQLVLDDPSLVDYNKDKLMKGVIAEVPSGVIFHNVILANLGPKIPIRLTLVGDINANIITKVSNYGINNALMEVSIHFDIESKAVLPFSSQTVRIETDVPIAIKIMQGMVPSYYLKGLDQSSSVVTVPSS